MVDYLEKAVPQGAVSLQMGASRSLRSAPSAAPRRSGISPGVTDEGYRQCLPIVWAKDAVSEYIDLGRRRIPRDRTSAGGFRGPLAP